MVLIPKGEMDALRSGHSTIMTEPRNYILWKAQHYRSIWLTGFGIKEPSGRKAVEMPGIDGYNTPYLVVGRDKFVADVINGRLYAVNALFWNIKSTVNAPYTYTIDTVPLYDKDLSYHNSCMLYTRVLPIVAKRIRYNLKLLIHTLNGSNNLSELARTSTTIMLDQAMLSHFLRHNYTTPIHGCGSIEDVGYGTLGEFDYQYGVAKLVAKAAKYSERLPILDWMRFCTNTANFLVEHNDPIRSMTPPKLTAKQRDIITRAMKLVVPDIR
jgi:hypothetical protein